MDIVAPADLAGATPDPYDPVFVTAVTRSKGAADPHARVARGGAAGLVEQVTSHTRTTTYASRDPYAVGKQLNRERRLRRMRRCVIAHAEAVRDVPGFRAEALMVTLTYRPGVRWDRRQVSRYVTTVRNWLSRRGVKLRYQWVIETTRAGVPHYHLLFWVPHGVRLPKPDASGQWPHGSSRIEVARRAVGYLVKYATKGDPHGTHPLPFGARLFGCGGDPTARFQAHRMSLPMWLHKAAAPGERLRRVPGGYLEVGTGVFHRSPYVITWGRDALGLVTLTVEIRSEAAVTAPPPVFQPTASEVLHGRFYLCPRGQA